MLSYFFLLVSSMLYNKFYEVGLTRFPYVVGLPESNRVRFPRLGASSIPLYGGWFSSDLISFDTTSSVGTENVATLYGTIFLAIVNYFFSHDWLIRSLHFRRMKWKHELQSPVTSGSKISHSFAFNLQTFFFLLCIFWIVFTLIIKSCLTHGIIRMKSTWNKICRAASLSNDFFNSSDVFTILFLW